MKGDYVKKKLQVAAMTLGSLVEGGLDMANIRVNSLTTIVSNNVGGSGGSTTSELSAMSVQVRFVVDNFTCSHFLEHQIFLK